MRPSEALEAHRSELRELVTRQGFTCPRIVGSVLTGADDEESDLDLLVDPAEKSRLFSLAAFGIDAEKLLGVPVSVLTPDGPPWKFRRRVLEQALSL